MSPVGMRTIALCSFIIAEVILPSWAMIVYLAIVGIVTILATTRVYEREIRQSRCDAAREALREISRAYRGKRRG